MSVAFDSSIYTCACRGALRQAKEWGLVSARVPTCAGVRRRIKTGFPRHLTVTVWPREMALMSTSTDASASTSADAANEETALMTASRAAVAYINRAPPRTKYVNARFSAPFPGGRRFSSRRLSEELENTSEARRVRHHAKNERN